jgi:hypothetical protein
MAGCAMNEPGKSKVDDVGPYRRNKAELPCSGHNTATNSIGYSGCVLIGKASCGPLAGHLMLWPVGPNLEKMTANCGPTSGGVEVDEAPLSYESAISAICGGIAYGLLPYALAEEIRLKFLTLLKARRAQMVRWTG